MTDIKYITAIYYDDEFITTILTIDVEGNPSDGVIVNRIIDDVQNYISEKTTRKWYRWFPNDPEKYDLFIARVLPADIVNALNVDWHNMIDVKLIIEKEVKTDDKCQDQQTK